jgi:hypothetical protein
MKRISFTSKTLFLLIKSLHHFQLMLGIMPITYLPRTVHLTKNASFLLPFGWTNCPVTFISFIYDLNSQWKSLATKLGVSIDNDTNTRNIVDDIVSHSKDRETSLLYMECQLCTCLVYHLSISLKKNFIFPQYFEFLGNDICPDGNSPSQSKHKLLSTWPHPEVVRNIAKLIGLFGFTVFTFTTLNCGSHLCMQ